MRPNPDVRALTRRTADDLGVIADLLDQASSHCRTEARWIADNVPLREWSNDTTASYLRSSVLCRQVQDIEPRVARVATILASLLDALPKSEAPR